MINKGHTGAVLGLIAAVMYMIEIEPPEISEIGHYQPSKNE